MRCRALARHFPFLLTVLLATTWTGIHADTPAPGQDLVLGDCLLLRSVGRQGRDALHLDALEAEIVAGRWKAPKAGDPVTAANGKTVAWEVGKANKEGALDHAALRGGYAYWKVSLDADRVMLLHAQGHSMVYVNGAPRAGDVYRKGVVYLPVALRKGDNDLLFSCGRGHLQARLSPVTRAAFLDRRDSTLPDLIGGETEPVYGALLVVNTGKDPLDHLAIQAGPRGGASLQSDLTPLPPLSVRKVGFRVMPPADIRGDTVPVELTLLRREKDAAPKTLDRATINLRLRQPLDQHQRTFLSSIDGSVQYYSVLPAQPVGPHPVPPALFLTLHGADVEASGQAAAYAAKSWGHLVAPTNRRPFGFDWEDWGRLDALEVLDLARQRYGTDPQRTYLTGHSMGGHGTWHLGATFPDRFAAIGPSAGWVSFWSYGGARRPEHPNPVEAMLQRASAPGDTLALARNFAQEGVYILHGDADDNVPVREARAMKEQLSAFHRDLAYHEQPGAGHWWGLPDQSGTACVDWVPMFDFFARHVIPRPESVRQVDFVTASPGVSARSHWATILAQEHPLRFSSVHLDLDPGRRRFRGKTDNVARLGLDLAVLQPGAPVRLELDGQTVADVPWPAGAPRLWLQRTAGPWAVTPEPSAALKGPLRYGPFKEAFRNRVQFVYGTRGSPEENAWALAKARFDAETFWYRGNASVDVLPDTAFDPARERDRNVILYGHAESNAAWPALLAESPVQVRRGGVRVGDREEKGDDLACLFLRPRPGSDVASVGVVGGTGLAGLLLTDRLAYFQSGCGYPDCLIFGPETLRKGSEGVRGAGYFGMDWGVPSGEWAWQDPR